MFVTVPVLVSPLLFLSLLVLSCLVLSAGSLLKSPSLCVSPLSWSVLSTCQEDSQHIAACLAPRGLSLLCSPLLSPLCLCVSFVLLFSRGRGPPRGHTSSDIRERFVLLLRLVCFSHLFAASCLLVLSCCFCGFWVCGLRLGQSLKHIVKRTERRRRRARGENGVPRGKRRIGRRERRWCCNNNKKTAS